MTRSHWTTSLFLSLPFACALAACSASSPDGGDADGKTTTFAAGDVGTSGWCAAYCGRVAACDRAQDEQTCLATCANSTAAVAGKLRNDVVRAAADCFEARDCRSILGGGVTGACVAEATAKLAPSVAASDLCDDWVTARAKCRRPLDKATCLEQSKAFTDATLMVARSCTSKRCEDVDACVAATLGGGGSLAGGAAKAPSNPSTAAADGGASRCALPTTTGWSASCASCLERSCCAEASAYLDDPSKGASALSSCMASSCASACRPGG